MAAGIPGVPVKKDMLPTQHNPCLIGCALAGTVPAMQRHHATVIGKGGPREPTAEARTPRCALAGNEGVG
eukprot:CAMPEP_0168365658 /NCGR_PEP_ID=MMETSP0228-20121227/4831_1 /TAXON_ID=133427 /ORGANISM="Protoceratium reticulatum, Strain CCCM 535 (=CCMP 1889)" /LENGTH=69 /DNA_ID=CAMNT_0008378445 /DNA_START=107 /DNA_END=313 /DNA_ORIENTATION=-